MCFGPEAFLIASLAASAGGMALSYDAQRDAQRERNRQIAENNRRLEEQFAREQALRNAAMNQIEQIVDRETDVQRDLAAEKQTELARRAAEMSRQAQEEARQVAQERRMATFDDRAISFDATPIGRSGPRVVQERAAQAAQQGADQGRAIVAALSGLSALSDVDLRNAEMLTEMGRALDDMARQAGGRRQIADTRVGNLNRAIADITGRPYETLPVYEQPGISGLGTVLSGLGQIGSALAFMGADPSGWFRTPTTTGGTANAAALKFPNWTG